ncbi:MAG TPA: hypothetical protein PKH31_04055 [Candidatus Sumerlaeota bacterium]|nr:hypothetical protein [Candidatus Sumerlaeota bacterium]
MRKQVATVLAGLTLLGLSMSAMGQQAGSASGGAGAASRGTRMRSNAERASQAGMLNKTKKTDPDSEETTPGAQKSPSAGMRVRGVVTDITTGTLTITEKSGQVSVFQLTPATPVVGTHLVDVSRLKGSQQVRMEGSLSSDETTFTAKTITLLTGKSGQPGTPKAAAGSAGPAVRKNATLLKNLASGELVVEGKKATLLTGDKKVPVAFGSNMRVLENVNGTPKILTKGMDVFVVNREENGKKVALSISLNNSQPNGKKAGAKQPAVKKAGKDVPAGKDAPKAGKPGAVNAKPQPAAGKPAVKADEKKAGTVEEKKAADVKAPEVEKPAASAPEKAAESAPVQ